MVLVIDGFEILKVHLLVEDHLVETRHKVGVEESVVEDREAEDTPDKLEVLEVLWVYA